MSLKCLKRSRSIKVIENVVPVATPLRNIWANAFKKTDCDLAGR
jgi:hypothetical protein